MTMAPFLRPEAPPDRRLLGALGEVSVVTEGGRYLTRTWARRYLTSASQCRAGNIRSS